MVQSDNTVYDYPWDVPSWKSSGGGVNYPNVEFSNQFKTLTVDHTAVPKEQNKETTFGGSQSMTVKRDIEPLLSKVVGGASAAYSLRDLNDVLGNSNKVVRVRRSSDNAEKDFTASEMGVALEDWVNTDVTIYQSDFSSSTNEWAGGTASPVGNQDGVSDGTTSKDNVLKLTKAQDSQAYITRDQGVIAGLTYTVSGSFYAPSSNTGVDGILIKDGVAGSSLSDYPSGYLTSNGVWTDFSFSYTATVSGSQRINMGISSLGSNPNGSSAGSAGDVVYIADLHFVETTSNGFVQTWYDQSGNGNDAEQTTASSQPKIVDTGALVSGGIDFDGVDDYFLSSHILSSDDVLSLYAVGAFDDLTQQGTMVRDLFYVSNSNNGGFSLENNTFTLSGRIAGYGDDALVAHNAESFITEGSESLFEMQLAGGSSSFHVNGSSVDTISATMNSEDGGSVLAIGASATGTNPFIGQITEIIIYNSDQSSNRPAIETNIANQYGITLS
jgi:hypothetical protein